MGRQKLRMRMQVQGFLVLALGIDLEDLLPLVPILLYYEVFVVLHIFYI